MTWRTFAQISLNEIESPVRDVDFTPDSLKSILQIVFGLIGAAALIILVISAIKFQLALGDPQKVAKARNAIIYAAVGLAVSVLAFSIVSMVLGSID